MSSIYKRNGVWQIQYRKPGEDAFTQESLKTRNRFEAETIRRQIDAGLVAARIAAAAAGPAEKKLCSALRPLVAEFSRVNAAPGTAYQRDRALACWLESGMPDDLSGVSPADIEAFKKRQLGTCEARTVNYRVKLLRICFNVAIRQHWFSPPNPFAHVPLIPEELKAPFWLHKREEIDRLMAAARAHSTRMEVYVGLCVFAGMRPIEIVNARWEWFDFEARCIVIQPGHGFTPKSKKFRAISLKSEIAAILSPHRRAEGFLFNPERKEWRWRHRYEAKRAFRTVAINAGFYREIPHPKRPGKTKKIPTITPRTLRHTFASQLTAANVGIQKISRWLGHADVKTTHDIYSHVLPHDGDIERF